MNKGNTFKRIARALSLTVACALIAGCAANSEIRPSEINPLEEAANTKGALTRLYFGYRDESFMAGEARVVEAPVNGRAESAVLRELISGPGVSSPDLTALINPDTKVVDISESGDFLFVTLSGEFLKYPDVSGLQEGSQEYERSMGVRRLAVLSIVNTLIEMGEYSRVQILVDSEDAGRGQRVKQREVGFAAEGDATLEPLSRDSSVILDSGNTAAQALKAYAEKDWERLYDFIAVKDSAGDRPEKDAFMSETVIFDAGIEEYSVLESTVSPDGDRALCMVSYTYKPRQGDKFTRTNVPLRLVNENSVWKVPYAVISRLTVE